MTGWRAGAVAVAAAVVAAGTAPSAARANLTAQPRRTPPSAEDQRDWKQYEAQLNQLLATENMAQGATSATGRSVADCKLFQGVAERVPAQECMSCHGMHRTHPVELDYEMARFKPQADLRAADEVVRRGVFLPDGKVQCVTCHDPRSRWAYHLAIPPGALVRPAVNVRDPSTYERPVALVRPEAMPAGTSVSPTPLCKVCHTLGD